MKELQKKHQTRRILYSIPSLVALSIIALLLVRGGVKVVYKERESHQRLENVENKLTALVIREQELKDDIARLKTREGIEDEIRDRFSVTADGEYVAIVVDEKKTSTSTDNSQKAWYKRLWTAIIGGE